MVTPTNEHPEIFDIGIITLNPGEPYYYTAWGIRYRFKGGNWRIADMAFSDRSDAIEWMKEYYLRYEGMEGEPTLVKRCVLLDKKGNVTAWTEGLS